MTNHKELLLNMLNEEKENAKTPIEKYKATLVLALYDCVIELEKGYKDFLPDLQIEMIDETVTFFVNFFATLEVPIHVFDTLMDEMKTSYVDTLKRKNEVEAYSNLVQKFIQQKD